MSILVTGGTGLVGSRFLKRAADSGGDYRAIVRPGKTLPDGVTAVEADLLDAPSLVAAVEGVTAIVHLAAVLRTPNPDDIWAANVGGTRNLIAAAKDHAPKARFIMASTGLVYAADSVGPAREDDGVDPKMPYPASKVAAEKELRESGLNWSILRLGFVYGDQDGHLAAVPTLADRFSWHPASRLSLLHHQDIAVALNLALAGAMDGRIVNIADEAPMSIYEIANLVGSPIAPSSEPLVNPWWGQIDGTVARDLGFQPTVPTVRQAHRLGLL